MATAGAEGKIGWSRDRLFFVRILIAMFGVLDGVGY